MGYDIECSSVSVVVLFWLNLGLCLQSLCSFCLYRTHTVLSVCVCIHPFVATNIVLWLVYSNLFSFGSFPQWITILFTSMYLPTIFIGLRRKGLVLTNVLIEL